MVIRTVVYHMECIYNYTGYFEVYMHTLYIIMFI